MTARSVPTPGGPATRWDGEIRMDTVHVDCDSCVARGPACSDCVVTVLLGSPQHGVDLDGDEQQALAALATAGLVPPLRLVPGARRVQAVQSPLEWTESG